MGLRNFQAGYLIMNSRTRMFVHRNGEGITINPLRAMHFDGEKEAKEFAAFLSDKMPDRHTHHMIECTVKV